MVKSPLRSTLLGTSVFSDESFTERANRWTAAARMWRSRPLMGFGPGTYESKYAPFQNPHETTRRTTWEGDEGDAHSEIMTALAEQGRPGGLLLCAVLITAFFSAARTASQTGFSAGGTPGALAGAVAAFALLNGPNSFLDAEKVVPLFWIACAATVNLDLRTRLTPTESTSPADH